MKKILTILLLVAYVLIPEAWAQDTSHNTYVNDTLMFYIPDDPTIPFSIRAKNGVCPTCDVDIENLDTSNKYTGSKDRIFVFGDNITPVGDINSGDAGGGFEGFSTGGYDAALGSQLNLQVTNDGEYNSRISLAWDAVSSADGYLVYRGNASDEIDLNNPIGVVWGGIVNTYDDDFSKVTIGGTYYYQIRAFKIHDTFDHYISGLSATVVGSTVVPAYTVTNNDEYRVYHHITVSQDALYNAQNEILRFEILDNGSVISEQELSLYDIEGAAASWSRALQLTGASNQGLYVNFDPVIYNHTGDWTVDMTVKRNDMTEEDAPYLVGSDFNLTYSETEQAFKFNTTGSGTANGSFPNIFPMAGEWRQLTMVKEGTDFRLYVDGHQLPASEVPRMSVDAAVYSIADGSSANLSYFSDLQLGMVRAWDDARSSHQVALDYARLYRMEQSGNLPHALVNEWVMDSPFQADVFGLSSIRLAVKSTDLNTYNPTWVDVDAEFVNDPSVDFMQYVTPGSAHSFEIRLYEQGTGLLIAEVDGDCNNTGSPALTALAEPMPAITNQQGGDGISFDYTTTSLAERYSVTREDSSGQIIAMPDLIPGETYLDIFDYDNENSLKGANAYTYHITPQYAETGFAGTTADVGPLNTSDYSFAALAGTDQNDLSWDQSALAASFTDTVLLSRDGVAIVRLVDQSSYADTDITYGQSHVYGLHALVNGEITFSQYSNGEVAANGEVSGWFLSSEGFLLSNITLEAVATIEGEVESTTLTSDEVDGSFLAQGIYYGMEAGFELSEVAGASSAASNDEFILSVAQPKLQVFVTTDSVPTATEETTYMKFEFEKDDGSTWPTPRPNDYREVIPNSVVLTWRSVWSGWNWYGGFDLVNTPMYTNVYRNEELIGIVQGGTYVNATSYEYYKQSFHDSTGVFGENYTYRLRTYVYSSAQDKFYFTDYSFDMDYQENAPIKNFMVQSTTADADPANDLDDAAVLTFQQFAFGVALNTDHFDIYRKVEGEANGLLIGQVDYDATPITDYSFTDYTGIAGTAYTYYVTAVNESNESKSAEINFTYPQSDMSFNVVGTGSADYLGFYLSLDPAIDPAKLTNGNVHGIVIVDAGTGKHVQFVSMDEFYDAGGTWRTGEILLPDTEGDQVSRDLYLRYYKNNEDGRFVFDNAFDSSVKNLADNLGVANLNANSIEGPGYYKVTWNTNGTTATDERRAYKTVISAYNNSSWNTDYFEVDQAVGSWAGQDVLVSGSNRYLLQVDEDNSIVSSVNLGGSGTTNDGTTNFQEIENLFVSQDIPDAVVMTWDYKEYADARFVIYQDGVVIDTTRAGDREYFHNHIAGTDNIRANEAHAYQVQAIYDSDGDGDYELFSSRATGTGMRRVYFIAEGFVYDSQQRGVPYVDVNIGKAWTRTDSTGFYQLTKLFYNDGANATLRIRYQSDAGLITYDQRSVTFDEEVATYKYNFKNISRSFDVLDNPYRPVLDAFAVSAYVDPANLGVKINMQLEDKRFEGVEVKRFTVDMADLQQTDALTWNDLLGGYGEQELYALVPYEIDDDGEKVYGRAASSGQVVYPNLDAPNHFYAVTTDEGYVQLQWYLPHSGGRSFQVYRNDVLLTTTTDQQFLDNEGGQGETYKYQVYTVSEATGEVSDTYASATVLYPMLPGVKDLQYAMDVETGTVTLSWDYQDNGNIEGYQVWKNDILFAAELVTADDLANGAVVIDEVGIPGALSQYDVVTHDARSNVSTKASLLLTYPDLPVVDEIAYDQATDVDITHMSWSYGLADVAGFNLSVVNSMDANDKIEAEIEVTGEENGSYAFTWTGGVAGANYDITLIPFTDRIGEDGEETRYEALAFQETQSFNTLPTEIEVTVASGYEAATTISWEYASTNYDRMMVTIDGLPAIEVGVAQNYLNVTREDGLALGNAYNITLEAITDGPGGQNAIPTINGNASVQLTDQSGIDYSNAMVDGDAGIGGVLISFEANPMPVSGDFTYYRDGELINTISASGLTNPVTYTDEASTPGVTHAYEVKHGAHQVLAMQDENLNLPGKLDGSVVTAGFPNGIPGMIVTAETVVDGRAFSYEVTSEIDGTYVFSGLRVEDATGEPVTYLVSVSDPDEPNRLFTPASQSISLSKGVPTRRLQQSFRDGSSVLFEGLVSYSNEILKEFEETVKVYGMKADGTVDPMGSAETVNGHFSINVSLRPEYIGYKIRLTPLSPDMQGVNGMYSYFDLVPGEDYIESELYEAVDLVAGDKIKVNFVDQLTIPTTINFQDACGIDISGYSWKLSLSQIGNDYNQLLYTDPVQTALTLNLPPVNYELRVMDVSPLTSESKAMLEFFRGENVTIAHGDSLVSFTKRQLANKDINGESIVPIDEPESIQVDIDQKFRLSCDFINYRMPDITMILGGQLDSNCIDEFGFATVEFGQQYNLNFNVKNTTSEGNCVLTSGYFRIKDNASDEIGLPVNHPNADSVFFLSNGPRGAMWYTEDQHGNHKPYLAKANKINTAKPYTQLIEADYFTANGRYVTSASLPIIVTGSKVIEGSDFFLDIQDDFVPLYVLHDPPGDGSSAAITAGSSMSYNFNYSVEGSLSGSLKATNAAQIGVKKASFYSKLGATQTVKAAESRSFSISFSESISTASASKYDPDAMAYISGELADVIVGFGLIQQYGLSRNISIDPNDQCQVKETLKVIAEPKEITSTFSYTVHEILQSIRYYKILLNDPNTVFDVNDHTDLIPELLQIPGYLNDGAISNDEVKEYLLESRIKNLEQILEWHQAEYRVPAQVCEYIWQIKHDKVPNFGAVRRTLLGLEEDITAISSFCNSSLTFNGNGDYSMPMYNEQDWNDLYRPENHKTDEGQLKLNALPWSTKRIPWDNDKFEKFKSVTENFYEIWAAQQVYSNIFHNAASTLDWWQGEQKIKALVENKSFSALNTYSKALSSSNSFNEAFSTNSTVVYSHGFTKQVDISLETETSVPLLGMNFLTSATGFSYVAALDYEVSASSGFFLSQSKSTSDNINIRYTLSDDDQGDHFNTWIMTDPTGMDYFNTPEFYLTSGKSSCPYEEGTIARDQTTVDLINEHGEVVPNVIRDQPADEGVELMWRLTQLSPYREGRGYRFLMFTYRDLGTKGSELDGLQNMDAVKVLGDPTRENLVIIGPGTGTLDDPEQTSSPFSDTIFKFPALEPENKSDHYKYVAVVLPGCGDSGGAEATIASVDVYYDRPPSPVSLPLERGDWLVNGAGKSLLGIELNDMIVDNEFYELDEVYVEIRNKYAAQDDWMLIGDTEGRYAYKRAELAEMGEYPVFQWDPTDTIPDGEYQIRASIIGDDDGFYQSELWSGRIDQTKPYPARLPEPADGLLSKGDAIGLKMSEAINSGLFYTLPDKHTISVFELDGITPFDFRNGTGGYNDVEGVLTYHQDPFLSDYTIFANGSEIDVVLKDWIMDAIDGKIVTVSVSGLQDMAGNTGSDIVWTFKSDHNNYPVSEVSVHAPDAIVINSSTDASGINVIVSNLDIFETRSVLDEYVVQYSIADRNNWTDLTTRTINQIRDFYQSSGQSAVLDESTLDLSGLVEGEYDLRVQARGEGNFRNSNTIRIKVDLTSPQILGMSPAMMTLENDLMTIEFSESMDLSGATITGALWNHYQPYAESTFGAFKQVDHGVDIESENTGKLYLKLDTAHADYNDLFTAYGKKLVFNVDGATDEAGNVLTGNGANADIIVGNFATSVSEVVLSPSTWTMNKANKSVDLEISGFDLFGTEGTALDSIRIEVRETGDVIDAFSRDLLEYWHSLGDLGDTSAPVVGVTWSVTDSIVNYVANGTYTLNAVAFGDNGKARASYDTYGTMDFTNPVFTGQVTPNDNQIGADEHTLSFSFTEDLSADLTGTVELYQDISGTLTQITNNNYWVVKHSGRQVLIYLSGVFQSTYSGDNIEIHISGVEDPAGNALQDDVKMPFAMAAYTAAQGTYATDLSGARLETGQNELTWTSYRAFENTALQRSRDGVNFTTVAEFDGSVDRYLDEVNFSKIVFYRLSQTTAAGDTMITKAIGIENANALPLLNAHVFPTLSDGTEVSLSILTNDAETDVTVDVTDIRGQVYQSFAIPATEILNSNYKIEFGPRLNDGMYFITIKQGDFVNVKKILVQPNGLGNQ